MWGWKNCAKVQEKYNRHSWGPLKMHFKWAAGDRGLTNGEKKRMVEDAKDQSIVQGSK